MAFDAGQGFVDILPAVNPVAFNAALSKQITPALSQVGTKVSSATSKLGAALGTPLGATVGIGVAAGLGKLTIGFEDAFTKISAVSNASAEDIERWRGEVLSLAGETAQAPQALADALFFLASAGLEANQIMPTLKASAQAATVGLGELADISRLTANVLNAYPESGLKAIDVIDTLVAAVREGTAEPEEFADAIGRILPIASKAGIGIDEVVASLAALSNIGLDVDEGVTAMRGVMQTLLAPTLKAKNALAEMGISSDELRASLAEDGLIATLRLLDEASGGNIDTMNAVIGNVRALTGAFGLTEQQAAKVDALFRRVADATGDLSTAVETTAAGPGQKFRQALVDIQTAAIRLGQIVLPVATTIAQAFTTMLGPVLDVLGALSKIPGFATAITTALAGFATLKFVVPLLLSIAVGLERIGAAGAAGRALSLGIGIEALGLAALKAGPPLALIGVISSRIAEDAGERHQEKIRGLRKEVIELGSASGRGAEATNELALALRQQAIGQQRFGAVVGDSAKVVISSIDEVVTGLDKQHRAHQIVNTDLETFQKQLKDTAPGLGAAARSVAAFTDQNFAEFSKGLRAALAAGQVDVKKWGDFVSETMGKASEVFAAFQDQAAGNLNFVGGALSEMSAEATSAADELATADLSVMKPADIRALREAADLTAGELLDSFKDARRETQAFGQDLLLISRTSGDAGKITAEALLGMGDAGVVAADTIAEAGPKMREKLVESFAGGQAAAETLATRLTRRIVGTLESIRDILDAIARKWGIEVTDNTPQVKENLRGVHQQLMDLDGQTATVNVVTLLSSKNLTERRKGGEHGFVIPGAQHGAFITDEQFIRVGEKSKDEMLLPLEDPAGHRKLVRALQDAGAGGGADAAVIARAVASAVTQSLKGAKFVADRDGFVRMVTQGQERRRSLVGA